MKILFCLLFLCTLLVSAQAAADQDEDPFKSLAILPFANTQPKLQSLADALPDILISELVSVKTLRLVERSRIDQAQKAVITENQNFSTGESELKIGKWLGAQYLLLGGITQIFENIRIDLRIIDVASGTIHFATGVEGRQNEIMNLVKELGIKSRKALESNINSNASINSIDAKNSDFNNKDKTVSARFYSNLKLGLFTTRNFPVQVVRVYVDGQLKSQSEPLNKFNKKWTLFEINIPLGQHSITLEHGTIDRKGNWVSAFKEQPQPIFLDVNEGGNLKFEYDQVVYNSNIEYKFHNNFH